METATDVADEMAAQVATQMAATVTQPSRRVRHDVTESEQVQPWARTGMLRVRLSMRCRQAAQRLARMGYAVLVTCVGEREANHPLATSQFLPANPV